MNDSDFHNDEETEDYNNDRLEDRLRDLKTENKNYFSSHEE